MPADRFTDAVEAIRRDVYTAAAVTKREERARFLLADGRRAAEERPTPRR